MQIWEVLLRRFKRDPKCFDLSLLAHASEGFTGAEVEKCIVEGLYSAFEKKRQVAFGDLIDATGSVTPISTVMGEKIKALEEWAKNRAQNASDDSEVSKVNVNSFVSSGFKDIESASDPF
jgi:hypothetical protein